jgi:hypothetical protein
MIEQEMFIHVYAAIMQGYTSRISPLISDSTAPDALRDFAKKTAMHAVESSREFVNIPVKTPDPMTPPAYVHTFVHAHSNWVAVDLDGCAFEYIDEPQLSQDGQKYISPLGNCGLVGKAFSIAGLKQKRQR